MFLGRFDSQVEEKPSTHSCSSFQLCFSSTGQLKPALTNISRSLYTDINRNRIKPAAFENSTKLLLYACVTLLPTPS